MTLPHKHMGFILNKIHYGEADIILKIINEEGKKLTLFAKAAKKSLKRFAGGLDYFHLYSLEYTSAKHGGMGKLFTTSIITYYDTIKTDLTRFALANVFVELIDHFLKEDDSEKKLFHQIKHFFETLQTTALPLDVYCNSLMEIFRILGYGLDRNTDIQNALQQREWNRLFHVFNEHILVHGQKELKSLTFAKKILFHT